MGCDLFELQRDKAAVVAVMVNGEEVRREGTAKCGCARLLLRTERDVRKKKG